jgi:hypothetical protein
MIAQETGAQSRTVLRRFEEPVVRKRGAAAACPDCRNESGNDNMRAAASMRALPIGP